MKQINGYKWNDKWQLNLNKGCGFSWCLFLFLLQCLFGGIEIWFRMGLRADGCERCEFWFWLTRKWTLLTTRREKIIYSLGFILFLGKNNFYLLFWFCLWFFSLNLGIFVFDSKIKFTFLSFNIKKNSLLTDFWQLLYIICNNFLWKLKQEFSNWGQKNINLNLKDKK